MAAVGEFHLIHLAAHWLGLDNASGAPYLWWSGIGSDLGELTIVAVIWHHLHCHQKGCWRIARHRFAGFCRKHKDRSLT